MVLTIILIPMEAHTITTGRIVPHTRPPPAIVRAKSLEVAKSEYMGGNTYLTSTRREAFILAGPNWIISTVHRQGCRRNRLVSRQMQVL